MRNLLNLWHDERGFVNTIELVFIATILVIGLVAGWKSVNQAVNDELEDLANAFGSIDQTYSYGGVKGCCAESNGSRYEDSRTHYPVNTCADLFATFTDECFDINDDD